jgi:hypothetical protein
MHRESLLRTGAERPIVVGDRLDTDIEGANAVGCPSLLVLSGVTRPRDLLEAPPQLRPTYLADDVRGLLAAHPRPREVYAGAECGRWQVRWHGDAVRLAAPSADSDAAGEDRLDALRALCAAVWASEDRTLARLGGGDSAGAEMLAELDLAGMGG